MKTILEIKNLSKEFKSKKTSVKALSNVSFQVNKGETIGIVGESGCGKTTLGRCIARAYEASRGEVLYTPCENETFDFLKLNKNSLKKYRKDIQMIFQDPYSSLDPRMTVFDIISEPLLANYPKMSKSEREQIVIDIAKKTGLNTSYLKRYPHAFSGGQRQRIGIARALVINPKVIICDESVSALDVSIQAQIINLLKELQESMNLTYIFISHDLSVVEYISDKVGVMYLGELVEFADTKEIFSNPQHPYTEALLSSVPIADPLIQIERIPLEGEVPNPSSPPSGCYFHPRCRYANESCKINKPKLLNNNNHIVSCNLYNELNLKGIKYD